MGDRHSRNASVVFTFALPEGIHRRKSREQVKVTGYPLLGIAFCDSCLDMDQHYAAIQKELA